MGKKTVAETRKDTATEQYNAIDQSRDVLQGLHDEVRESYDNMPENLQGSEKGEKLNDAATMLETVIGELETAMSDLDGIEF